MAPEMLLRGASSSFAQGWTRGRRSGREIVGCSRSVPVLCQCLVREGHEAFGVKAVICSSVTPMRRSSKAHVRFVAWFSSCDVYTTSPFMSTKKDCGPRGGCCPLIADRGGIRLDLRGSRFRRRIWMTDVNVRAPHGKPVQKSGEGTDDEYRNQSNEDNEHLTAQFCSPWGLLSRGLRCLAVLGERLRRLRLGCLRAAVRGVQRLGYRATRAGVIVVAHELFLSHSYAEHDAVATQASSRGSRNERLDFLIGDADQHVVKDPGEACGFFEVFRRGRRTIGGVNDVAVSVLGAEGPDI